MTMTEDRDVALVTIERKDAYQIFTEPGATDPIIARLQEHAANAPSNVSTLKGRKEIAAYAYKFATSKSFLESFGKELADEQKAIPKKIDAARKLLKDTCDALRDQVRAPLDAWEAAEELRVSRHRAVVSDLEGLAQQARTLDLLIIRNAIHNVEGIDPDDYEEFADEVSRAKTAANAALTEARAAAVKAEADRAELEELRKLKADRDAADAKAAAENAEAERIARIEQEAAERAVKAERDKVEAEAHAERAAAAAREAELERQAFEARRAQERAEQEAARVAREAEQAKAQEEAATAAREADKVHRGKINREALDDLIAAGLTEDLAKIALTAIVRREVRHVAITY